jgi:hypothetical protein
MDIKRIVVLGAGGIGGNIPLSIGMLDEIIDRNTAMYIMDDDIMEISNMNRIPVPISSINKYKVDVIKELCKRTMETRVSTKKERVSNFDELIAEPLNEAADEGTQPDNVQAVFKTPSTYSDARMRNKTIVIDCRDVLDAGVMFEQIDMKLSYNGGNIMCITFNPTEGVWKTLSVNVQSGYEVTPSFYIPPAMVCEILAGILKKFPASWICGEGRKIKKTTKIIINLEEVINEAIVEV